MTSTAEFPDGIERFEYGGREYLRCARCGSDVDWVDCWKCGGEGYSYHDCGEDCCCCMHPEPNVVCDICGGRGGWRHCISGREWCGQNPKHGREHVTTPGGAA